jgi:RecA-family ATPase
MTPPLATDWAEDTAIDVTGEQLSSHTLPPIVSAEELLSNPPPKPPEIVAGLLHQGCKMVLGGASKTNKTWVLTDLAISVATVKLLWDFETTQGDCLYVNF